MNTFSVISKKRTLCLKNSKCTIFLEKKMSSITSTILINPLQRIHKSPFSKLFLLIQSINSRSFLEEIILQYLVKLIIRTYLFLLFSRGKSASASAGVSVFWRVADSSKVAHLALSLLRLAHVDFILRVSLYI